MDYELGGSGRSKLLVPLDRMGAFSADIFGGCGDQTLDSLARMSLSGRKRTSNFVDFGVSDVRYAPESGH